jgi:DNA-binding HxlR family transcriptional regulator
MSTGVNTEYCSFTKAAEYLGDRWCLLILRELAMRGPLGFSDLAREVPGHISRSVLIDRLHRLCDLGVVSRASTSHQAPYGLTSTGQALIPTMLAFNSWADGWLPEDPAFVARDPEIVLGWLTERVELSNLPDRQVIVELRMRHEEGLRSWLVLEVGVAPYGCLEDPLLDEARYVYLEAGLPVLMSVARGRHDLADAIADGSIEADGDPALVEQLPNWFKHAESAASAVDTSSQPEAPELVRQAS